MDWLRHADYSLLVAFENIGNTRCYTYMILIPNCIAGLYYGLPSIHLGSNGWQNSVNGIGIAFNITYVVIYAVGIRNVSVTIALVLYLLAIEVVAIWLLVDFLPLHLSRTRLLTAGGYGYVITTVLSYAPTAFLLLIKNIRDPPVIDLYEGLSLVLNFINNFIWILCGYWGDDGYVFGAYLSSMCLLFILNIVRLFTKAPPPAPRNNIENNDVDNNQNANDIVQRAKVAVPPPLHHVMDVMKTVSVNIGKTIWPWLKAKTMICNDEGIIIIDDRGNKTSSGLDQSQPLFERVIDLCQTQKEEVGDGMKTAVVLATMLLENTRSLFDMDYRPLDICRALKKALDDSTVILNEIAFNVNEDHMYRKIVDRFIRNYFSGHYGDVICEDHVDRRT